MPKISPRKLREAQRALIDTTEPKMERAYQASFADIKNNIVMADLVRALARHDVAGAIAVLNIEPAAFAPLHDVLKGVYTAAGRQVVAAMPPLEKKRG